MLNQESSVPLYVQLKNLIKQQVDDNILHVGDKLASENEFIDKYNISRITIRKALSELVNEDYLIKKQGKGTFIRKPKLKRPISYAVGFTMCCRLNNLLPMTIVKEMKVIDKYEKICEKLNLNKMDKLLFIKRIRYADNTPVIIENNYYSYNKFSFLEKENLNTSLYEMIKNKLNLKYIKAKDCILTVTSANTETAKLLNTSQSSPIFVITNTVVDQDDNVLYYGYDQILGEKYCFDLSGNLEFSIYNDK